MTQPTCKFVAGQKVAALFDGFERADKGAMLIHEGQVYQIRAIELIHDYVYVNLMEHPKNWWIDHTAFRALDDRKTDISVFERLLKTRERELVQ